MKYSLIFSLLIACCFPALSQSVTGKLVDASTKESLPFANVVALQLPDSVYLAGTVTDEDGVFDLIMQGDKNALLRISYIGYQTKEIIINAGKFQLGTIELSQDGELLSEVVVQGTRKLFRLEQGGLATDIANSSLSKIGSAVDVLSKVPFVFSNDEEITVVGKGEPLIYINNRLVRDRNELDQLSSTDIKKVVVITNPGPEYDATVNAVIKIETLRPVGEGLSGSVFAAARNRRKFSHTETVDLNYRMGGLDIFGSFGYEDNRRVYKKTMNQVVYTTEVQQVAKQVHNYDRYYVNGGINYIITPEHAVGVRYSFDKNPENKGTIDIDAEVTKDKKFYESYQTSWDFTGDSYKHLLNAYYDGDLVNWLHLKADFDYVKTSSAEGQQIYNIRMDREEEIQTESGQSSKLFAGKLVFSTPVWDSKILYGGEFVRTTNDQLFYVGESDAAEHLSSNSNVSEQNLVAAFINYSKVFGNLTIDAGLRFEHVNFDYTVNEVLMSEQSRKYNNLFPTVNLAYQYKLSQFMLGYRSTTQRPGYYYLRNTVQYDDPYTYESGNPYLQPYRINDLSFSYLWKDIKILASYKMNKNEIIFNAAQYKDTDILLFKPENVDKSQQLLLSCYYSPRIKVWRPVLGVSYIKNFMEYEGNKYNKPYALINWQNSFELPYNVRFGIDMLLSTEGNRGVNYFDNSFITNVNLTKSFLKDRLLLNINANNILNTERTKRRVGDYPVYSWSNEKNSDTRGLHISIRYRFNSVRSNYKGSSAAGDELQRL